MSARAAIEMGLYSGLMPAALALIAGWLLRRIPPERLAARYQLPAAFALAVVGAVVISQAPDGFAPNRFWDWLPYLGLLAAFAGGSASAEGIARVERWAIVVLTTTFSAWMIVPTWDALAPARPVQVAALAIGMAALTLALQPLATRLERGLVLWLLLTAAACAALILAEVSETFARLAAVPAGALAGCCFAGRGTKSRSDLSGLALPYAVLVAGYAYVAAVYPSTPLWLLMLVPFAPLTLWLGALGPLARLSGWRATLLHAACVLVPIAVVGAILVARSAGDDW